MSASCGFETFETTSRIDVDRTLKMAAVVWQLEGSHVYLCHCVIAARFANALNALHPTPARWQAICVRTKPKPNSFYMNAREVRGP